MNASPPGFLLPQDEPGNGIQHIEAADSVGSVSNLAAEDSKQHWQFQLQSLQEWICKLLIANQRLRWALEEMKEHELMSKTNNQQ
jgi:hypothetical protein